jgi:hypothetical protein
VGGEIGAGFRVAVTLSTAHVTHVLVEGAGLVKHIAHVCYVGHISR